MTKLSRFPTYSLIYALFASGGGFLFGYCASIIAGALFFIKEEMSLTTCDQAMLVSTLLVGAALGASFGGSVADKFGRRFTLLGTSVLFILGGVFLYFSLHLNQLLLGRFVTGIAIGIASLVVPLYIAEISPPHLRGRFVSFNQLAITVGILIAYAVNYALSSSGEWRIMFGLGLIPSFLFLLGIFFLPETPSWLAIKGQAEKAASILKRVRPGDSHEEILKEIKQEGSEKKTGWRHFLHPSLRPALFVGIGMSIFQQITGINAVIYYAPKIFQFAGLHSPEAVTLAALWLGIVNVLMTLLSLWLIDRAGRRALLIIGISGMALSLVVLSSSFLFSSILPTTPLAIESLFCFVAFFAMSLGPVVWLIVSEIYPIEIRGRAMGMCALANWLMNYLVSLTFLPLTEGMGSGRTFLLYALISVIALYFTLRYVPETKGKSLDEIQNLLKKKPLN